MRANHVIDPHAPSAARVAWDHYRGARVFPSAWADMMAAVDKADSARFSREEVLQPAGWNLLNFLMDARTGLGRCRQQIRRCARVHRNLVVLDLGGADSPHHERRLMRDR